jgi:hypothetical protein
MATYIQIGSTITVGSGGASSMDFTSIPSTYTDLILKTSARTSESNVYGAIQLKINGAATGKTLSIQGAGSGTPSSFTDPSNMVGLMNGNTSTSLTFASAEWYIPNAFGSTFKSISSDSVTENNATEAYARLTALLWQSTNAITSISLVPTSTSTFAQYSTASLYGISKS